VGEGGKTREDEEERVGGGKKSVGSSQSTKIGSSSQVIFPDWLIGIGQIGKLERVGGGEGGGGGLGGVEPSGLETLLELGDTG